MNELLEQSKDSARRWCCMNHDYWETSNHTMDASRSGVLIHERLSAWSEGSRLRVDKSRRVVFRDSMLCVVSVIPSTSDNVSRNVDSTKNLEIVQCFTSRSCSAIEVSFSGRSAILGFADGTVSLLAETTMRDTLHHSDSHRPVTALAINHSGSMYVIASEGNKICMWHDYDLEAHEVYDGHSDKVTSLCVKEDGSRIVSGSQDGTVKIWEDDHCISTLGGEESSLVSCVAMSGDSRTIVAGYDDGTVKVWDSGELLGTLEGHICHIDCVAISLDGTLIVSGSQDGVVRFWQNEACVQSLHFADCGSVIDCAISADGLRVACVFRDGTVIQWTRSRLLRKIDGVENLRFGILLGGNVFVGQQADNRSVIVIDRDGSIVWKGDPSHLQMVLDQETHQFKIVSILRGSTIARL